MKKPDPRWYFTHPKTYSLVQAALWSCVIAVSLAVSISVHHNEITKISRNVARAYIDKDILYRDWNALHGGVYMQGVAPSPYLPPTMPERDVVTPSGRLLTLVNPAYMTRQIYELAQQESKVSGRITSLKPLRPENKADAWETAALREFEVGAREVSGVVTEGEHRTLRLMRPLVTEESCLPCHAGQKYRKGDIRGGISIKLPMDLFESSLQTEVATIWVAHGIIWAMGLSGFYAGYVGMRRRTEERDLAEEELKRANAALENQATTDALTGLCNRRKLLELLRMHIQESKRYGMPLVLIFFDIDHFKRINDTWGHEAGDHVLQELARLVTTMVRQTDIFARLAGEEFIILAHNNDVAAGRELAEKIRSAVEQHPFPRTGKMTCSFGVTQFDPDDTAESIIKRADEAMYTAKQKGRNRIETR